MKGIREDIVWICSTRQLPATSSLVMAISNLCGSEAGTVQLVIRVVSESDNSEHDIYWKKAG